MKRTRKRILCVFAAAALTLCSLPQDMPLLRPALTAYATETITHEGVTYTVYDDHAAATSGGNAVQNIVIAEKINGLPVTEIEKNAFYGCVNLVSVTLPDTVKVIGESAFEKCTNLTGIDLNAVTVIDKFAFGKSGLTEIKIPDTVTEIGMSAFVVCPNLRSVSIGSGLNTIGSTVFANNLKLETFTVSPENKTFSVKSGALYQKNTLLAIPASTTEFWVPSGTEDISYVCAYHPNLKKLTINSSVLSKAELAFAHCPKLETVIYTSNKGMVDYGMFVDCPALKTVTLPKEIYKIKESAFKDDPSLEEIVLPETVDTIPDFLFGGCGKLSKLTILHPSAKISTKIFALKDDDPGVPFTGTIAGYDGSTAEAFAKVNGYSFESLGASFDPTVLDEGDYGTDVLDDVVYHVYKDHAEVAGCLNSVTELKPRKEAFGIRVTKIADGAFWGNKNVTSVELPETITEIGENAFFKSNLKTVKFNSGLKTIGSFAFAETPLIDITLPDTLETLSWCAFYYCKNLTEVQLPASLQNYSAAFDYCGSLKKIKAAPESKWFCDVDGILYSKDMTKLVAIPCAWSDTDFTYTLPDSVTTIAYRTANAVHALTEVKCSDNSQLRDIGFDAFWNCYNLKTFPLLDRIEAIGNGAFENTGLETVTLPESVSFLDLNVFMDCKHLKEAILPDNIQSARSFAFCCPALEKLVFLNPECEIDDKLIGDAYSGKIYGWKGSTAQKFAEDHSYTFVDLETVDDLVYDGIIYQLRNRQAAVVGHTDGITKANIRQKVFCLPVTSIADNAFTGCDTLTSLTIPEGITSIGDMAFRGCKALTGVIRIPDSVETIGLNAFQNCENVKKFDFGVPSGASSNPNAHIREIGFGAFEYCYALEEVLLPESVRIIGGSAFHMCSKLYFANCGIYVEEIGSLAFADCSSLLYCGTGYSIRKIGEGAFRSCKKLDLVYIMDSAETLGKNAFSGCTAMQDIYIYSKDVKITDAADTICSVTSPAVKFNGTIHGYSNSTAQAYAEKYGYKFALLDEESEEKVTRDGIFYKIYEDHAEVIGCEKTVHDLHIQPKVKGQPVTAIAGAAFEATRSDVGAVESIFIPGSVKTIGESAFAYQCLDTLILSEGLETIEDCAFMQTSLTDVTIPDSVKEIGDEVFDACYDMRSFHLGAGTEKIGHEVLRPGKVLETITVSPGNKYFKIKDGMLYSADEKRIVKAPCTVTEYDIPEGVEIIDHAFECNENLTSVSLPGTITSMHRTFDECVNLKTVTLGEGIREIFNYTFSDCAFEELLLPESMENFGGAAAPHCKNLVELTFPENVKSVDRFSLGGCTSLIRLTFLNPECEIHEKSFISPYNDKKLDFCGVIVGYDESTAEAFAEENNYQFISLGKLYGYLYYKKYTDHIEIIGHTNKLPEKAEIPAKIENLPVTVVREGAFRDAAVMKEIKLPETLVTIGNYAFRNCGITALVIPDQTASVGIGAFAECSGLETLTLGAKTVGVNSFAECTALKSVTLTDSVRTLICPFDGCPALTALTFPDTVETVLRGAYDCAALETLTAGAQQLGGVYDYWNYPAFDALPALKELTLTASVKSIKGSLSGMPLLESLELPASVASVDCRLFDSQCTAMMADGKLIIRNPECVLDAKSLFDEADNKFGGTVYGYPESTAETYCKANDIKFVPICTVSYDCAPAEGTMTGGEFFGEVTLPEISITVPKGMTFLGWQTEKYAQVYKPGDAAKLTKDTVFHAYYEPVVCTVKFDANGGTGTMTSITADSGSQVTLPLCGFTAPEGMQFAGWQIKGADSPTCQPGAALTVEADLTLIPVWWDGKNILIGDVDLNGIVDTADAMLLTHYVNAWPDTTVNLTAADLNQDGVIDNQDAMLLTRYAEGWDGYDGYIVMTKA